jgi:protein tyrosine/serine phosphatase
MGILTKSFRGTAAALLATILTVPVAAAQSHGDSPSVVAEAVALPIPGIFNFGVITPSYFRGGELKARDVSALAARGVKTVIDLRSDGDYDATEAELVPKQGMTYVRLPMNTRIAPTLEQVTHFLSLVTNPANQPVYVHCVEGRHRTGVMTAVYRMAVDGWTAKQAFAEMKHYKFGFDFLHPEFKKFVFRYTAAPLAAPAQVAAIAPAN